MWAWAIWPWATEAPPPATPNDGLLTAVLSLAGVVIAALIGLIGALWRKGGDEKPANGNGGKTNERVAVLERRQDDTDGELDMLDRLIDGQGRQIDRMERHGERLDQIEGWLDREDPGWRRA